MKRWIHRMRRGDARVRELCVLAMAAVLLGVLATRMNPRQASGSAPMAPETAGGDRDGLTDPHPTTRSPAWPAGLRRDPFHGDLAIAESREDAAASITEPQLRVGSILLGQPARAVINDTVVQEGDFVGGYLVKRIEQREVVLERNGRILSLRL